MILTKEEYLALGFDDGSDTQNGSKLLTDCLKRAEYVVNGLTDGMAAQTALRGGKPAEYVKQACGFQAQAMLRYEIARAESDGTIQETGGSSSESGSESSGSSQSSESSEKVTIGDFSYSVSSGSSSGTTSGSSSGSSSGSVSGGTAEVIVQPFETDTVVVSLLRAAGCLFGVAEVRE
ncbi:MAG: hypothetical protein K2G32_07020 [Oscillospiraceae bacterium]|nr:hypothetical protein [Oscillospiraceae bacterium]